MPTKVSREQFLRTLESVYPGVSPREILEQSSCFVLLDGDVCSFNDEVACRAPSGLGRKVKGAVKAEPLLNVLRQLPEEEIEVSQGYGELVIQGKRREAHLRMEADIALPVDSVKIPAEWKDLPAEFGEAVGLVGNCAGEDQSRFNLTCVHIHPKWVEACDNFQLCRWRLRTGVAAPVLIRQTSAKSVVTMGANSFAEDPSWLHFKNAAGLVLSCRRYVEDYPDLTRILDVEGEPCKLPKGLAEAADKAAIFSKENPEQNQVLVELRPGRLAVKGSGASGWYRETKKLDYQGRPIAFLVNPELLAEVVNRHRECRMSADRLKVEGPSYVYVACLGKPEIENGRETDNSGTEPKARKRKAAAREDA
jgi:hypothetical protein